MAFQQDEAKNLWLWMLHTGGGKTISQIARQFEWSTEYTTERIFSMLRSNTVVKFPVELGERQRRYGVTGLCRVPQGMTLAEVQL